MWPFLRKGSVKKKSPEPAQCFAIMETAGNMWPDNIDTTDTLIIKQSCTAADVYPLICDRPNIKTVQVGDRQYTSQEIRNTSFHERLGNGGGAVLATEDPVPTFAPTTVPAIWFDEATIQAEVHEED